MKTNFLILCTGYNCSEYTLKCYNALTTLDYPKDKYTVVMVDDGSTDGNDKLVQDLAGGNVVSIIHDKNYGAAYGRWNAVQMLNPDPETVIVLIGMDDYIFEHALSRIDQEYQSGKWMTYGNWIDQYGKGLPDSFDLDFPAHVHKQRSYRQVLYRSTGLNTFKTFLFNQIPEEDFKIDGKWIDSTTESEVMFSCLEMCGKDRIGIIRDYIVLYNRDTQNGTLKRLGKEYKYKLLNIIKNRPKREPYEGC